MSPFDSANYNRWSAHFISKREAILTVIFGFWTLRPHRHHPNEGPRPSDTGRLHDG